MLDDHPLARVLTSMPGVGVRTGPRILLKVGDGSAFTSAGHLTAYTGIAPVTQRSGTSIRGELPARSGNRNPKRAPFLSAFDHYTTRPTAPTTTANAPKQGTHCWLYLPGQTPLRRPLTMLEGHGW